MGNRASIEIQVNWEGDHGGKKKAYLFVKELRAPKHSPLMVDYSVSVTRSGHCRTITPWSGISARP